MHTGNDIVEGTQYSDTAGSLEFSLKETLTIDSYELNAQKRANSALSPCSSSEHCGFCHIYLSLPDSSPPHLRYGPRWPKYPAHGTPFSPRSFSSTKNLRTDGDCISMSYTRDTALWSACLQMRSPSPQLMPSKKSTCLEVVGMTKLHSTLSSPNSTHGRCSQLSFEVTYVLHWTPAN